MSRTFEDHEVLAITICVPQEHMLVVRARCRFKSFDSVQSDAECLQADQSLLTLQQAGQVSYSHASRLPDGLNFSVNTSEECPVSSMMGARSEEVRLMGCTSVHTTLHITSKRQHMCI